jgi:hypothetical protein
MAERWIEYLDLAQIAEADRNPKTHAADDLEASIQRFGFVEPITMDERTEKLVAGHGRLHELQRSQAAGDPPPDGVRQDSAGNWLAPVVRGWASTDDLEADAYLLASNHITELGGWADPDLAVMLADLALGGKLSGTGFTTGNVDDLLASLSVPDIDDLADQFGKFDESTLWPVIKVQVSPEVFAQWQAVTAEDDVARLQALLDAWANG